MKENFRRDMHFSTHKMVVMAMMLALTCTSTYLPAIQLSPTLAVTYQSFFAILNGLLCGAVFGAAVQIIYLFMGLIGIPIFSNGGSGFGMIMKPSFGFLIGFIFAAFVAGLLMNCFKDTKRWQIAVSSIIATFVLYPFGMAYMVFAQIKFLSIAPSVAFASLLTMPLFLLGDFICLVLVVLMPMKLLRKYALTSRHARNALIIGAPLDEKIIGEAELSVNTTTIIKLVPPIDTCVETDKNVFSEVNKDIK